MKTVLSIDGVSKQFQGNPVLNHISFDVHQGEFITLLGPSGCGKTTLLRIIGGFEELNEGKIFLNEQDLHNIPTHLRPINTVFQKYALFPHMNVFDNIAFGLFIRRVPPGIIKTKVGEMLKLVKLEGFENRSTHALSGGQQQRVAIARALINEPEILLLDEPLGALDLKLRQEMQRELKRIQRSLGITFIFVTHDQEEALGMSDRILVMNKGNIEQMGTPINIYNEPINSFVADFIGESNILNATMKADYLVAFNGQDFECLDKGFLPNEEVDIVIRPEDIALTPHTTDNERLWGVVESILFIGVHYEITVNVNEQMFLVHSTDPVNVGDKVSLHLDPDDIHVMSKTHA